MRRKADNPKTDVWFGGTATFTCRPRNSASPSSTDRPSLPDLHPGPASPAIRLQDRRHLLRPARLRLQHRTARQAQARRPQDLGRPAQTRLQGRNPGRQSKLERHGLHDDRHVGPIDGRRQAFEYLKGLHRNVAQYARSGTGPIKAVARGESAVSISFIHDAPGEKLNGFPVETITPSEGTGAEIGSMSLIKGSRNQAAAKKFYEWALTPAAQKWRRQRIKQFQLPSNKHAKIDPRIPDFKTIKFIDYDYAGYGTSAERRRLIARWEKKSIRCRADRMTLIPAGQQGGDERVQLDQPRGSPRRRPLLHQP